MSDVPPSVDCSELTSAELQRQNNRLNEPNSVSSLTKLLEQLLPVLIVSNVMPILEPMITNLVQRVVKEQLDLCLEKLQTSLKCVRGDETHTSELRYLSLKFLDVISFPVYTGEALKGKGGTSITIALFDVDGKLVQSGTEASSKVEIVVVQAGIDDDDSSSAGEESDSCTKLSEKKLRRPRLSQKYLKLKEGIAVLDNMKFKNQSKWTKNCRIKLVARMVGNIKGAMVQEAETESFPVCDHRGTLYKKRYPPLLSDELWRLREIRRNGKLHMRLLREKINSVEQLLISYNTDPQSLQNMLDISAEKLKVIVDHANTCQIPGKLYKYHSPSCKRNVAVVFDAVGRVRGQLHEDGRFVQIDDLAEDKKVGANKMVISAFKNRKDVQSYDYEASTTVFPSQVGANKMAVSALGNLVDVQSHDNEASTSVFSSQVGANKMVVPALGNLEDVQSHDNEASTSVLPSQVGANKMVVSAFGNLEDVQSHANESSTSAFPSQVGASKMVVSAFGNLEGAQSHDNEASTSVFPSQVGANKMVVPALGNLEDVQSHDNEASTSVLPSQVGANKMVISAFGNLEYVQSHDNEASTSVFPSQVPNDVNTSNSPLHGSPSGSTLEPIETFDGPDPAAVPQFSYSTHYWDDWLFDNGFYPSQSPFTYTADIIPNFPFIEHDEQLQFANPPIVSHNVPSSIDAICQELPAQVPSPRNAKGRWKTLFTVAISVKLLSMKKRIEAQEDTHAQKKQRRC